MRQIFKVEQVCEQNEQLHLSKQIGKSLNGCYVFFRIRPRLAFLMLMTNGCIKLILYGAIYVHEWDKTKELPRK